MKKKATRKKKGIIPRQETDAKPPKVGRGLGVTGQVSWPRVGRQQSAKNNGVQKLADALKTVREENGTTVAQLAKQLKIAPATLIKFEDRGHPISVQVIIDIADKLGYQLTFAPKPKTRQKK
ncbi:MAG: helix-turn-helix transcriptional regulator [Fuerstiella sp.]